MAKSGAARKPAAQRQKDRGPQSSALPFGSQQRQTLSSSMPVNLGATPSYPVSSIDQRQDPSSFRLDVHHVSAADLKATGPGAGTSYQLGENRRQPGGYGSGYDPTGSAS